MRVGPWAFALAATIVLLPPFSSGALASDDLNIIFQEKIFVDVKEDNFVLVSGTLTGDWIGYPNNSYTISCQPMQCIVGSIEQFTKNLVGRVNVSSYNVERWLNNEIIAVDDEWCMRTTITIDRSAQTVYGLIYRQIRELVLAICFNQLNLA